jgi:hypothetical protein
MLEPIDRQRERVAVHCRRLRRVDRHRGSGHVAST